MFHNRKILYYFLGLVFPILLIAQDQHIKLNFQKLTLGDGLTDDRNNGFIYQDSKGFTWISSIDGLNRFDGTHVKTYRFESGMLGKNIQSNFYEDKKSNIWFSTFEAINCYVRQEDSIRTYKVLDSLGTQISEGYKVFHLDTSKNRLWLKAGKQIFGLNINDPSSHFSLPAILDAYDYNVSYDDDGNLNMIVVCPWWYGNGVDFFYLKDTLLINHHKYLADYQYLRKSINLEDSIWLFYQENQFLFFDEAKPNERKFLKNELNFSVWDIAKFKDDFLILSTIGKGMWLYNWRTEKYIRQWKATTKRHSLMTNKPRDLHLLGDHLWVYHTNEGVNYTYLYHNNFENPIEEILDKNVEIASICKGENESIIVGTKFNGIFSFSLNGDFQQHIEHPFSKSDSTELWQVVTNNNDWVASTKNAIYIIDSDKLLVKQVIKSPDSATLRYLSVFFPNRIILSTNKGIKELYENHQNKYKIKDCPELADYKEFGFLQFFQTSDRKLYIPANANELWIYQANYQGLKLVKKIKCNLEFFGFCESKKYLNTIWTGTSKGLVKIVNDTSIQYVMDENALLSKMNVYGVVEDNNGKLWISTNQGLWKYDEEAKDRKLTQFNEIDGLSGDFFSLYNCSLLSNNSEIWMGNNKGLVKFNPNKIKPYSEPPKVYINELLINDTEVYKGIGEEDFLELPYDKNTLTFDVAAINLIKPEQNKIHYRLNGYSDDTLSVDNNQLIRYTKIPHGKYGFEVTAVDANGNKSKTKTLSIKINPPFWKTWWFCLLSLLTIAFLIYAIYKSRVKQLIKEEEKKTTLEKLKNQLLDVEMKALRAQMNPHFLFNAMNSIKGIIVKKEEKKAADYLTKFSSLLRGILANSEKKKIVLAKEIEALKLYIELESLRFTREFNYQIQIDKNIDTGFTRIPPLILQPFVENAIWHGLIPKKSGINKLNINIFRENDFVILEIEDNGVGRKKEVVVKEKKHKSMGIGITEKRAKLLHSENEIRIIDLVDNTGNAMGTKVSIKLYAPE